MRSILLVPLRLIGSALRAILVGVLAVAMIAGGVAFADYTATQGSGTTFASIVIATKHYMAMAICDATAGESQCAAVNSSGQVATIGVQSGAWNFGGAAGSPVTMQSAAVANGNGTALTVTNDNTALINVNCSVACSGGTTINFEGTDSTSTYFSVQATPVAGTGASVNSTTTSGQFCVNVIGYTTLRARISAYSAGTITITGTPAFGGPCPVDVVNTNTNGQQTAANSSPVVPPSDMLLNVPLSNLVFGTTAAMTSTTSTQLIAGTSSKVTYVTFIKCTNSSATATLVTVQDGSGGTTLGTLIAPAGGGDNDPATLPIFKTSSGNGLFVANVTGSASVICTASGFHG